VCTSQDLQPNMRWVGDHQLASVAQHEDRTKEALQNCENVVMARNAKKIKQVCPLSLPSSSSFIISSQCIKSKAKATSHEQSFFIPHLHPSLNKQTSPRKLPESQLSRNARSTNNTHRPIPSNISPRSTLKQSPKPKQLPSTQKWVLCGLKASAASTLVRHPLPHAQ